MAKKKIFTRFIPKLRTRHPSHKPLKALLPKFPFRSVIRFGSFTELPDTVSKGGNRIEINTVEAIKNSANKLRMKQCFTDAGVKTAQWVRLTDKDGVNGMKMPVVIKSLMGSRGRGNYLIQSLNDIEAWNKNRELNNYIMERFHDYSREYRLHVDKNGCFYACRKMLKNGTPEDKRWFRNDSNSTWIMEENPAFDKPVNWNTIIAECVKALNAVGLDVGACDVKVQSAKNKKGTQRTNPEFIVIEINSAPSFGAITLKKYVERLPAILMAKKKG